MAEEFEEGECAAVLNAPAWLRDATPFPYVALLPAQPFRTEPAVVMTAIGIAAAMISMAAFRHRDLTSV